MYAVREAFSAIQRTPLLAGLSAAMVALALFVVGIFGVVSYNLHQALGRVEERVEVVAYIRDTASSEDVRTAEDELIQLEDPELWVTPHQVEVVRSHQERHALSVQVEEDVHDAAGGPLVQVARRLVGQEHERLVREGTSDGHTLLFTPG